MAKIKVVHYINQFFAGIGGEEKADIPAELHKGEAIGPGMAFNTGFGDEAEIIATIVCGDSYFNENIESAKAEILGWVKDLAPDLFIAGPAFNAGRYGVACGTIAAAVKEELGIKSMTGMYTENPGADMYKDKVYILETKDSAAGMRAAVKSMTAFALKYAKGEKIGALTSLTQQSIRCLTLTELNLTLQSRTWHMQRSHWSHPEESYQREILTTSRVQVLQNSVNTALPDSQILMKTPSRQLTADMTLYMQMLMRTEYSL